MADLKKKTHIKEGTQREGKPAADDIAGDGNCGRQINQCKDTHRLAANSLIKSTNVKTRTDLQLTV